MATIRISQLPNINGNLTPSALLPIVSTNGTFITDKISVTNLANYILGQGGNIFVPANISNLSYNVINAAQPNITSLGTLTGLTVLGTTNLGYPNNIVILGGTAGQVLSTDGNGSIGWVSQIGPTGATGVQGATGLIGLTGATGPVGPTGSSGPKGDRYSTTSTTSLTIGTGNKTLTVETDLAYTVNQDVVIAYDATNDMNGSVVSYDPLTGIMVVNVVGTLGSGTYTSWTVNLDGAVGTPGPTGATGATGPIAGSNTQVIFNDDNVANGSANLTFNKTNGELSAALLTGTLTTAAQPNITSVGTLTGLTLSGTLSVPNTAGGATNLALGDPTQGNLVSNAVTLSNSSSVSNAIAQLNQILGKLVPPAPPTFPAGQTISIGSLSTYRMANYTQTDNTPGANKSVAGGTVVSSVRRLSSYTTSNVTNAGPGDSGNITVYLNGTASGSRVLTTALDGNGTYSNLVIFNNYDYNVANANITAGFWSVFSARADGTVSQGWNEVFIADSAASNTNTANWFYDSSAPGTPVFSNTAINPPSSPNYTYSSTVPHYNNTNAFTITFDVNRLSGNMYPTSDTFATGAAGGAFNAPTSRTYAQASIATPLDQNLYVASGVATVNTSATIVSGFGASTGSPTISVTNSYNTGTGTFSPGANVLYKTGTASSATRIEEANVFIGSSIGVGSGLAFRIVNPGSTDTPTYSASAAAFNSQTGTLETYDATVVANILKHDITNYSTGYLPAGPNLSTGRTGSQYFTFKFIRTSVSKFDVKWTGTLAGLWVALPGSAIDSTSGLNGWIDMSVAYAGAGVPGSNVGAGGNGSNGCALGGVAPLNSAQTNKAITATFGTVSSSSTATNEIYVRVKLASGQSITALSLQAASN